MARAAGSGLQPYRGLWGFGYLLYMLFTGRNWVPKSALVWHWPQGRRKTPPALGELATYCSSFWFAILVGDMLTAGFHKISHRGFGFLVFFPLDIYFWSMSHQIHWCFCSFVCWVECIATAPGFSIEPVVQHKLLQFKIWNNKLFSKIKMFCKTAKKISSAAKATKAWWYFQLSWSCGELSEQHMRGCLALLLGNIVLLLGHSALSQSG